MMCIYIHVSIRLVGCVRGLYIVYGNLVTSDIIGMVRSCGNLKSLDHIKEQCCHSVLGVKPTTESLQLELYIS